MRPSPPGRLHVITDETRQSRFSHVQLARLAAEGGADVVQFREKRERTTAELVRTARAIKQLLRAHGTCLIVNDRADVALAADADGVHLGRRDLEPGCARRMIGGRVIGGTANNLAEALSVAREPVDYLGVGPVYGSGSKADPAPALGVGGLKRIVEAVDKPVVAIGNITLDRIPELIRAGVHGVAVLSDVICSDDPAGRVAEFRQALEASLGVRES